MAKDTLARGAKSASFGSLSHIDPKKWAAIWEDLSHIDVANASNKKELNGEHLHKQSR